MNPLRVLGGVELGTLALMLLNLVTIHHPVISGALGPLHGLAYTATVIAAVLLMRGRHRVWLLALVPGVGGLLASRAATDSGDSAATDRSEGERARGRDVEAVAGEPPRAISRR
ncbi:hypothetical protein [Saccharopolyspora griseoalba]|uniref:DUF3817 domain-containing protein n=1 Tax=Saccharopolyspora griseoalba TaxID=1431848 RepID=A0ABW2LER6_9PSEU